MSYYWWGRVSTTNPWASLHILAGDAKTEKPWEHFLQAIPQGFVYSSAEDGVIISPLPQSRLTSAYYKSDKSTKLSVPLL